MGIATSAGRLTCGPRVGRRRAALLGLALGCAPLLASAQESGEFPPAREDQVTLTNWLEAPHSRWGFRNVGILPSLMVPRDGEVHVLPRKPDASIEALPFRHADEETHLLEAIGNDAVDGILVLHGGTVVYERYFGDFGPKDHHLWASCTKSLVSMALGILVEEGRVDPDSSVSAILPELTESGFGRVTIRHLLDMTSALDYVEDYVGRDLASTTVQYFRRMGFLPAPDLIALDPLTDATPRGILRFLPGIGANPDLEPGTIFDYQSPNVDVIGWIISRVSGQSLERFVANRIWAKLGAEHDAFFATDNEFVPIATGGFSTTLRDAARFGLAVSTGGTLGGVRIFPESWLEDTLSVDQADLDATSRSVYREAGNAAYDRELEAYRNFWWILDAAQGEMMARGVFGQSIYIHRDHQVVIALFSSAPSASNARRENYKKVLRGLRALGARLGVPTLPPPRTRT